MKKQRKANRLGNRKLYVDENGKYILYGGKKTAEELAEMRKNRANVYVDRKKQNKRGKRIWLLLLEHLLSV